jgi:hypothetical protein
MQANKASGTNDQQNIRTGKNSKKNSGRPHHQGLSVGKEVVLSEQPSAAPQPEHPQPQVRFFGLRSDFHIRRATKKRATATAINTRICCIFSSKGAGNVGNFSIPKLS